MANDSQKGIIKTVIGLLVIISVVLALTVNKYVNMEPTLDSEKLLSQGVRVLNSARGLDAFELDSDQEKGFTNKNLQGSWSLVFFGFTHCPDVCPTGLAFLNRLVKTLPELVQIVFVTTDPARDSAEAMRAYADYFNPEFKIVRGEFMDLQRFASQLNASFMKVPLAEGAYTIDHTAHIAVIDPQGRFVAYIKSPYQLEPVSSAMTDLIRIGIQ